MPRIIVDAILVAITWWILIMGTGCAFHSRLFDLEIWEQANLEINAEPIGSVCIGCYETDVDGRDDPE